MITLTAVRTLFTAVSNVEKRGAARPMGAQNFKIQDGGQTLYWKKCFVHIMAADC